MHSVSRLTVAAASVRLVIALIAALAVASLSRAAERVPLFDGKSLAGWEGNPGVWRVENGVIVGGSLAGNPRNEFLTTKRAYRNFVLRLEYKLVGTEGFVNGGVQFRSRRIAEPDHEMIGYQADIGAGYSGSLYDESRRKKFLAEASKPLIAQTEKPGEWNRYEIRCEGPRVVLQLNGRFTVDYTEREPGIEDDGLIGLQIHGGCKAEIAFRAITIEELSDNLVPQESDIMKRLVVEPAAVPLPDPTGSLSFVLHPGEIIVTLGQGHLDRDARAGIIESALTATFAAQRPRFRPMAWEGDTVYEQWREANFGDWNAQLTATGATLVLAQFGQMEAYDGPSRIEEFTAAYVRLLAQVPAKVRVVVLSPLPVETTGDAGPDAVTFNQHLQLYADAARRVAEARGALYVDLFTPLRIEQQNGVRFTTNGLHLSTAGAARVAGIIARSLGADALAPNSHDDALRTAVAEKNRIWFECWRPANWSFAYGDRATQPYGKPTAVQPPLAEIFARHGTLLAAEDARIQKLAASPKPPAFGAPLTSAQQQETFTLADGFTVNLFADETLGVVKPTQMAWDERGRMYIGCSPTYPQPIPGVKPGDYILVLEDTDGDGAADRTSRFAEDLAMVLGLEPGAGGLYVCDYDQLVHLSDTDGDGRADRRTVLLSGFGVGDTHQLINSISHGPDGSLWFSQGLHAFSRVETPWGLSVLEKAGLWRFRPRTQRLDAFFNGGKAGFNCWGVAFDDYGQMFHKSGDRPAGYYSVPGLVRLQDPDEYHPTGALFSSPIKTTALEIVGTSAMPSAMQGCAVIAGYFGNVVELHQITDDGAGFQSEQRPKLLRSTSPDFRPVDVSVGPDGAIYVADWYNPVIGHYQASYADPQRDKTRGRIWRITAKGRPAVKPPALHAMTAGDLLEQLRSAERWTRYQAKRLLFDRDSGEVVAAADAWWRALDASAPEFGRWLIEVAGVFQAHETPQPELVARLLGSPDPRVRAYGCRVVGGWADRLPNALALLSERIGDPHPRVRMEAVVACSEIRTTDAIAALVRVVDFPRDRFIDYALTQALKALQPQWAPALAAGRLPIGTQPPYAEVFKRILSREAIGIPAGKKSYDEFCLNCHQPDGRGLPEVYPPLEGSEWVRGDKEALIKMVLHGVSGPMTVAKKTYGTTGVVMPPAPLDDGQIADVLTYIRSSFGNSEDAVPIDLVRRVRSETSERLTPWTEKELNVGK